MPRPELTAIVATIALTLTTPALPAGAAAAGARDLAVLSCPPAEVAHAFADTDGNVHRFAIDCLATYALAEGTAPSVYSPEAIVTRGQAATIVYRMLDAAGVAMDTSDRGFTDVADSPHAPHINGIVSIRVARGTTGTTFSPGDPVTRAQMASLVGGAVVMSGAFMDIGEDAFDDDDGSVHETMIDALSHNRIVAGVAPRRFVPDGALRRDAMASLVMRAVDFSIEYGGTRSPFQENHRVASLTPDEVATAGGGEADAEGHAELWTVGQPDVVCFDISTTDVGSGVADHPERIAYLAKGAPGQVGDVLVELPPPSAANAVPEGADAWSGGCVWTDPAVVRALIDEPEHLYVGLSTWEHEEALRGQLAPASP